MALIKEEFDSEGDFSNYDAYDTAQRQQLEAQKHVDLRTFHSDPVLCPIRTFEMNHLTMTFLNARTIGQISHDASAVYVVQPGESWTAGTIGKQNDRNRQYGISLSCVPGSNSTTSVF